MLTDEQIDYLFKFCEKHYVYYYEVQLELVDHLANAIEAKMAEDKKLSFEDALDKVYKGFGTMGFAPIVAEKQLQVFKISKAAYWKFIKGQFGWPQVLSVLFFSTLLYYTISWNESAGAILLVGILFYGIASNLYHQIRLTRKVKKTGKKFALLNFSFHSNLGFLALYFLLQILSHLDEVHPLGYSIVVGFYIVLFVASDKVTNNIEEKLVTEYPDAFQVAS